MGTRSERFLYIIIHQPSKIIAQIIFTTAKEKKKRILFFFFFFFFFFNFINVIEIWPKMQKKAEKGLK